jgi:MFS family permease
MRRGLQFAPEVRSIALATGIRWVGWGFCESIFMVFWFSQIKEYSLTGFVQISYDLVFLLLVPLVGGLMDHMSARKVILFGLMLYPLIGLGHVVGVATGIIWFAIAAQIINGVTYACDSVGRGTLLRRFTSKETIAEAFGYFDTISMFGWIIAAFLGAAVVDTLPLPVMFLGIIPTAVIAFFVVYRMKDDKKSFTPVVAGRKIASSITSAYARFAGAILHWGSQMRHWGVGVMGTTALNVISDFILPIYAYGTGASLSKVMVLAALANIPTLFGSRLGWVVDKDPIHIRNTTFVIAAALISSLAMFPGYYWQLAVAFLLGIAVEILRLASSATATQLSDLSSYGVVTGEAEFFSGVAAIAGPVIFGGLLDLVGSVWGFGIIASAFFVLVLYLSRRPRLMHKAAQHLAL